MSAALPGLSGMTVIVTDGSERAALAVTRALGKVGCHVVVGSEYQHCLAGKSRFCSESFTYPSPYLDPAGFVSTLLHRATESKRPIVLPVADLTTKLLCQRRGEFEGIAVMPLPPTDAFERLSDKYGLMQLATSLEVPIPRTIFVPNGEIQSHLQEITHFPVVVKPGCSLTSMGNEWIKTGVLYACNPQELLHLYKTQSFLKQPSMIQQRVEGEGQGLFVLMSRGTTVALFAHRRVRERPPSGGVSVLSESISLPKVMTRHALRLLQHVNWDGVAMVEFKVDRTTGEPVLMEINGRFWGSLQLAIDAGVNFPVLLCTMATGGTLPQTPIGYRTGVRLRWLLGDLDHLLLRLFKANRLSLPPLGQSRLAAIASFMRFFGRDLQYDVMQRNDMGPFRFELGQYLANLSRTFFRIKHKLRRKLVTAVFSTGFRSRLLSKALSRKIQRILVLCHGNVCRSPLAEAYLRHRLKAGTGIEVSSAGLETEKGRSAHPLAVHVAEQAGLSLGTHSSTPVNRGQIDEADLILVMDDPQMDQVLQRFPSAKHKTIPLGYFSRGLPLDISDPYFGTLEDFKACYKAIQITCDELLSYLFKTEPRSFRCI